MKRCAVDVLTTSFIGGALILPSALQKVPSVADDQLLIGALVVFLFILKFRLYSPIPRPASMKHFVSSSLRVSLNTQRVVREQQGFAEP